MEITKFVNLEAYNKKVNECSEKIAEMMKTLDDIDVYIGMVQTYKCESESGDFYIVSDDSLGRLECIALRLRDSKLELDGIISVINN